VRFFLISLMLSSAAAAAEQPELSAVGRKTVAGASRLIVVTTDSWKAPDARLSLWQRDNGVWKRVLGPFAAVVGARGLSWGRGVSQPPAGATRIKKEGDKTAPAGVFRLGRVIGYATGAPAGMKLPYEQATARMRCVDDSGAAAYNQIVDAPSEGKAPWGSSEKMRRKDHLYERLALIDHNGLVSSDKPVNGGGSCIFLHVWRKAGKPTVGCTALSLEHLDRVLNAIPSLAEVLLVQLPKAEHDAAVAAGWLPGG